VKNFSAIYWREQITFQRDIDDVICVLDKHVQLDFYSGSTLKQRSASRKVTPLGHIILIQIQPVFLLTP